MPSHLSRPVEEQYTLEEAARLLKCSVRTIWRRIEKRLFNPPPWTDEGKTKLSASSINGYIERRRMQA